MENFKWPALICCQDTSCPSLCMNRKHDWKYRRFNSLGHMNSNSQFLGASGPRRCLNQIETAAELRDRFTSPETDLFLLKQHDAESPSVSSQLRAPSSRSLAELSQSISHWLQHSSSLSCQLVAGNQLDGSPSKLELF